MKKIFNTVIAVVALFTMASCSDVPAPYDLATSDPNAGKSLPYISASLGTGFTIKTVTGNSWSQGSTYTQISGWVNSTTTATQSESWLVSPGLCTENLDSVIVSFDYTIKYGNSLTADDIVNNHKVYISDNFDGDVATATWVALDFTPTKSTYSDWTCYPSGDIQVPDSFVGKKKVYVAFAYKCGATQNEITTWELQNFSMKRGNALANAPKGKGTKDDPYSCAAAIAANKKDATAANVWVKGYIVGFVNGYSMSDIEFGAPDASKAQFVIADTPDETNIENCMPVNLPAGAIRTAMDLYTHETFLKKEVTVYGTLTSYFNVPGIKPSIYLEVEGNTAGTAPTE